GLGGGIFVSGAAVTISSSTIYGNTSVGGAGGTGSYDYGRGTTGSALGGGIFANGGTISYGYTILLGNGAPDCAVSAGELTSLGNNLISDAGGCPGDGSFFATEASAGILPLADNGGPTVTHALSAGSPAIDTTGADCPFAIDQRGVARPEGVGCDIGAFEYQPPVRDLTFTVTSTSDDGAGSLRQAILESNGNPGFDTINFAVSELPQTITLASALPAITDHVLIDGTGQPGYTISGGGLRLYADGSTLRGLRITGAPGNGIEIRGSGNTVELSTITASGGAGVAVINGSGNRIRRNGISANGGLGISLVGEAANQHQPAPQISAATENAADTLITGTLATQAETNYMIDVYASKACDPSGSGEGETFLASTPLSSLAGGTQGFSLSLPRTDLAGLWITAVATDGAGNSSEFSPCAAMRTNDLWTNARRLNPQPTGVASQVGDTQSQLIAHDFQERWYRFPVTPGSRIRIKLTGQPGSTLSLHRDLQKIYDQLGAPQSAAAQAAKDLPSGYLPAGYLPAGYLPAGYLPAGYLPAGYLPAGYLPAGYLPAGYLPAGYLPAGYLPAGYLPAGYLPAGYLPAGYLPDLYAGAVRDSLMAYAVDPNGGTVLSVDRNSWDLAEDLYIRVTGPANAASPFSLQVTIDGGLCSNLASPPSVMQAFNGAAPAAGSLSTLILWDSAVFGATNPGANISALGTALSNFAARSDIGGTVINLADQVAGQPRYPRVAFARQQVAANPTCVSAANALAGEIKSVVTAYRTANQLPTGKTSLKYITLVGGDESIPFFRYTDQAGIANENEYFPPVAESSPSNASLRQGRVLGQDGYGSTVGIWRGTYELPLPDLSVGRLLGNDATVIGLLNSYAAANGQVRPQSALVTGYDFVADGAAAVRDDITAGLNSASCATQAGGCIAPRTLIQPTGQGPTGPNAWTADQLRQQLLRQRSDMVFFTGHFSAGSLLAADYKSGVLSSEVASAPASFTNSLIFALGCHSGYNVSTPDAIPFFSPTPDWAAAFAARGATYIASTGFAYGDTDLVEYGERYLLNLTRELRTGSGPVAIGQALVAAKQAYLTQKPSLSGMDEKTLLQFALYGLPMLKVDMPGQHLADPNATSLVASASPVAAGPGAALGLKIGQTSGGSSEIIIRGTATRKDVTLTNAVDNSSVTATYFTGGSGVVANPIEPIQPLEQNNVGVSGQILRGVGFRSGTYTDYSAVTPLTSAPATEGSRGHPAFLSDGFYPSQNWSANFFDTLNDGPTWLMAAGQYRSAGPGQTTGTIRVYNQMDVRLFYIDQGWTSSGDAALKQAAVAPAPDIYKVESERIVGGANDGKLIIRVIVLDKSNTGLQQVWITYTDTAHPGTWQSIDLAQDGSDPTLWTTPVGGVALPDTALFMAQAVSSTGRVSLDTNLGNYYSPLASDHTPATVDTQLTAVSAPTGGVYGQPVSFSYRLSAAGGASLADQPVSLSLGGQLAFATTDASGQASFSLTLSQLPGEYTAQAGFSGGSGYKPTRLAGGFTISKDNTRLTISPANAGSILVGQATGISAALATDEASSQPIADKTVIFVATGATGVFGDAEKTGQDGHAVLGAVSWPAGTYSV
ncbi:MAG: choice-of-anchor Q domain-containing protein, partial [Chloroflexales bacterium]